MTDPATTAHPTAAHPTTAHRTAAARTRRPAVHRRRWFTVLATMAAASAGWALARPIAGVDLAVRAGGGQTQQVEGLAVILTTLVVGLAGWLLLVLLERRTARALTWWTRVAVVVFVVSLLGPLSAVTAGGRAVLVALHVLVAGMLVLGMRRSG